mgnify:CR=1 FL=1|jgi:hypothetical protein
MATKSILKDVNIKDKQLARTFVEALERATNTTRISAQLSRQCDELKTETEIRSFLGK